MRAVAMRGRNAVGLLIALIGALVISCGGAGTDEGAVPVSVVKLLTDPQEFAGRHVQVTGYLQNKPTLRLFLSKDHGTARDIQSSVIVSDDSPGGTLTQSSCLNEYVQITGTFDKLMDAAWAIVKVEDVMDVETVETCWKRQ